MPVAKPRPCTKRVAQRDGAWVGSGTFFSMMLTKRVTAGLLALVLAVGGRAWAGSPPFVPDATIQALILAKTPLGSSRVQVHAFTVHPDRDVVPFSPDEVLPSLVRTYGGGAQYVGEYVVRGNPVEIVWDFDDGRHLSRVSVNRPTDSHAPAPAR